MNLPKCVPFPSYAHTPLHDARRHAQLPRLRLILGRLNVSVSPRDMNSPGLHRLEGARRGTWSVRVIGNWRITFQFAGEDAIQVDSEVDHCGDAMLMHNLPHPAKFSGTSASNPSASASPTPRRPSA
ncbi:MAG: type II toxin-antitoxin system RelE/ParE family toxin [Candidatus Hydrogenedentes bacterium]|nr:type II toxin-antitoxin system RelE/ParE family toxin [Candidatus Hydrogenedentota bacterium]